MKFQHEDIVFTFELHEVVGEVRPPSPSRMSTWARIKEQLATQDDSSWSNLTQVKSEAVQLENRLRSEIKNIEDYLQPLVMFGIFLLAVTILGVALTVIVSGRDTPEVYVPSWVTNWGWMVLLGTLSFAAVMTGLMGVVTVVSVAFRLWKSR